MHAHKQQTKQPSVSVFDAPPEDIFASQKLQDKDDIFGSSLKQPLKKPEKSLDELLAGKNREETDGGGKVREGDGGGEVREEDGGGEVREGDGGGGR